MARKSPAFSFYPDSWFGGTMLLEPEQRAAYIDLLSAQWLNGPLSKSQAHIVCRGVSASAVDYVLSAKFDLVAGRYQNSRLEEERSKQQAKQVSGSKGGSKRQANAKQTSSETASKPSSEILHSDSDSVSVSDLVSGSVPDSDLRHDCSVVASQPAEPPPAKQTEFDEVSNDPPEFPVFPTVGGKTSSAKVWLLRDTVCDRLKDAYPAVDVDAECRKAFAWIMANPARRKTASGMEDFLRRWCDKEQNRAGGRGGGAPVTFAQQRLDNTKRAIEEFINGQ